MTTEPTVSGRRAVVAIVGGARGSQELMGAAQELGRLLVDARFRIATGGLGGVMQAASRGARGSERWREGDVVGILPGLDASQANPWVDIAIPTGLNYARNVVLVSMADAVVAVGGGAGTLSEVAMAWQHQKLVVALDLGQGWSARLAGEALDARRADRILRAVSPAEALRLIQERLPSWVGRAHAF